MPVIIKSRIGGGIDVEIAINLIFAIGIAAGSLGAAALSHGRIELAPAPFLLLAMAALAIDMGLSTEAMPIASREVPLAEFFMSAAGLRLALEILLYSAAAGLFVVPIFAAVQAWAASDRRARVIAAVNALSYIWMVGGSLATMILLQVFRLSEPMALVVLGFANIAAAIYFFRRLPANIVAFSLRALWRAAVPARGRGRRKPRRRGSAERHCGRSRLVARRADPLLAHGGAADCSRSSPPRPRAGRRGSFFASPTRASSIPPGRSTSARSSARRGADAGWLCSSTREPRSPASR